MYGAMEWDYELVEILYDFKEKYNIKPIDLINFLQTFVVCHIRDTVDEEDVREICRRMYKGILESKKSDRDES